MWGMSAYKVFGTDSTTHDVKNPLKVLFSQTSQTVQPFLGKIWKYSLLIFFYIFFIGNEKRQLNMLQDNVLTSIFH